MDAIRKQLFEYKRPWKLSLLIIGITLLVIGSYAFPAPDWDIPISFIMALLTYLTAPWSMRTLLNFKWRKYPLMLFYTWFSVDGCYWIYWKISDPDALEMMRTANFPASLSLYAICGLIWYYNGSLKQLFNDTRKFNIKNKT